MPSAVELLRDLVAACQADEPWDDSTPVPLQSVANLLVLRIGNAMLEVAARVERIEAMLDER